MTNLTDEHQEERTTDSYTHFSDDLTTVLHGDCLEIMRTMPGNSVDAIITDPPYGLGFLGKKWDAMPPGKEWAEECLRILKPGGYLLAFGGSRTWHRLAVAVEDGGFEIRDSIAWIYGSGFPKSMNISKAIDKATGEEREDAKKWEGWGTALKPAFEPIVMARKPLAEKTVAANVLTHGVGGINIDATRIELNGKSWKYYDSSTVEEKDFLKEILDTKTPPHPQGRFPANVVLDEHTAEIVDEKSGDLPPGTWTGGTGSLFAKYKGGKYIYHKGSAVTGTDSGGASRFFYNSKAQKNERPVVDGVEHPTVKPLSLMTWLIKMVTPPGGVVLDPFAGSGTTLEAARQEGVKSIGIELTDEYLPLITHRIERSTPPVITEEEEA